MTHWWEHSPATNVARGQFRPGAICRLSLLLVLQHSNFKFQFYRDGRPVCKPAKADAASFIDIVNYFYFIYFRTKKLNNLSLENCNVSLEKRFVHGKIQWRKSAK